MGASLVGSISLRHVGSVLVAHGLSGMGGSSQTRLEPASPGMQVDSHLQDRQGGPTVLTLLVL